MRRVIVCALIVVSSCAAVSSAWGQATPVRNGIPYVSDEILLAERSLPWSHAVTPSTTPIPLSTRPPSEGEKRVIDRAHSLLASNEAKAIALVDGRDVVYLEYKAPAKETTLFLSASVAKTVTSMAVGQAVCAGKLKLDDRAGSWIAELEGKALGNATVRDLLRMASGAMQPQNATCPSCGNILTSEDWKDWSAGTLNLVDVLSSDRVARAQPGIVSDYKPGEAFVYKATDPLLLGIVLNRATGMPYAKWVQQTIFDPMGAMGPGQIGQNKQQQAMADSNVRLRMEDWIRFAWWVKQAYRANGCFGDYVREASRTQIANGTSRKTRKTGAYFAGYGYLVWTGNEIAPNSFWASGFGGQRIGWNYDSDRMLITFSDRKSVV